MKRFFAIALVLASSLPAQTKTKDSKGTINTTSGRHNPCPVEIMRFGSTGTTPNFQAYFLNPSSKTILDISFGVETMDADGNYHPLAQNLNTGGVKRYFGGHFSWTVPEYGKDGKPSGERLHIVKVMFSDGTAWTDDGTGTCFESYDYRK